MRCCNLLFTLEMMSQHTILAGEGGAVSLSSFLTTIVQMKED